MFVPVTKANYNLCSLRLHAEGSKNRHNVGNVINYYISYLIVYTGKKKKSKRVESENSERNSEECSKVNVM